MSMIRKAFKRLHYPIDVIAQCVRWYLAYAFSLRNLEEMMAERGVIVDHSTLHRWIIRLVPLLDKTFRLHKRTVGRRWCMDETYIKIKRRIRLILGFKSFRRAQTILAVIELIHMIRKGQLQHSAGDGLSPAGQFYLLTA